MSEGQFAIRPLFKHNVKIKKARDNRGWYICDKSGSYYLHSDSFIKFGVSGNEAFWRTRKEAREFYKEWKKT